MIYKSFFDTSVLSADDVEMMREKIRRHFTERVNLKSAESVASKALLCMLLKRYFGISDFTVDCEENGKPFIVGRELYFNISHSGNEVMCVCGDENVGCDIQHIKPYNQKVAKRFFTPEEYEALEKSNNRDRDFTALWALKESALKYLGEGLSGGLDRFDFSQYYDKEAFCAYGMSFACIDLQDCIYTVCCSDTARAADATENNETFFQQEVKGEFYEHH